MVTEGKIIIIIIIRVYSKVIYFDQRIIYVLAESKQNSTVIEGIKAT